MMLLNAQVSSEYCVVKFFFRARSDGRFEKQTFSTNEYMAGTVCSADECLTKTRLS